jgi:hypothetical protein
MTQQENQTGKNIPGQTKTPLQESQQQKQSQQTQNQPKKGEPGFDPNMDKEKDET